MILKILIGVFSVFTALYAWEYTALRKNLEYSPSITLNLIADKCIAFWKYVGRFAAWLSSFLTVLDLGDLLQAAKQLFQPLFDIILSWAYFFIGYISEMNLYEYPWMITIGSIVILTLIGYIIYRFNLIPEKVKIFYERIITPLKVLQKQEHVEPKRQDESSEPTDDDNRKTLKNRRR